MFNISPTFHCHYNTEICVLHHKKVECLSPWKWCEWIPGYPQNCYLPKVVPEWSGEISYWLHSLLFQNYAFEITFWDCFFAWIVAIWIISKTMSCYIINVLMLNIVILVDYLDTDSAVGFENVLTNFALHAIVIVCDVYYYSGVVILVNDPITDSWCTWHFNSFINLWKMLFVDVIWIIRLATSVCEL